MLLRQSLSQALQWESAHVGLDKATEGLDLDTISTLTDNVPYTIWQLVEHIRISQKDIVDFSTGEDYQVLNWPDDYWPLAKTPNSMRQWRESLEEIRADRQRMIELIKDEDIDLFAPFSHGEGQHLFRETVLLIDHESYHTGQIVLIRKLLGNWNH